MLGIVWGVPVLPCGWESAPLAYDSGARRYVMVFRGMKQLQYPLQRSPAPGEARPLGGTAVAYTQPMRWRRLHRAAYVRIADRKDGHSQGWPLVFGCFGCIS